MLWVDAASFVVSAAIVAFGVPARVAARHDQRGYLDDLRAGLRFLTGDSVMRFFFVVATIGNMLAAPVYLPVYANDVVESAPALGLAVAAYGVGGILGAGLLAPAIRILGRTTAYVASCVGAPIEALVRQERTPAELRARVF